MNLKGLSEKRKKLILISLIMVFVISVIGAAVYARYIKSSDEAVNNFSPAHSILPTINEKFEENDKLLKENVTISVGETDYPVYVRAAIIFTWKEKGNNDGPLYFKKPKETVDYTLSCNDTDWVYNSEDGYYYYKYPVASGGTTAELIESCSPSGTPPEGYTLSVDIIAQTVQAVGHTDGAENIMSVEDAWDGFSDLNGSH